MQPSFVHWIADIRMPHQIMLDAVSTASTRYTTFMTNDTYQISDDSGTGKLSLHHLGLVFTIDISSLSSTDLAKLKSISIVRCKREGDDRTVVASGCVYPTFNNSLDFGYTNPIPLNNAFGVWSSRFTFEFNSPEVNFNKNITFQPGDYIDIIGYHSTTSFHNASPQFFYKGFGVTTYPLGSISRLWDLNAAQIVGVEYSALNNIGSETYRNYYNQVGFFGSYHGTTLALQTDNPETLSLGDKVMAVANYKRTLTSQYGGNTFAARFNNEYIECARFNINPSTTTYTEWVFGGDTFLGMYDYLRFMQDNNTVSSVPSMQEVNFFPTESSINLWLRMDKCYSKLNGIMPDPYMLQEAFANGVSMFGSTVYPADATDLYLYNSVYSQENTLQTFYPKPFNFQEVSLKDVELICSNQKTNGEQLDSWVVFPVNNTKEVDANYGPINKLINFKNQLFFFQDKAFGIQYVLPRSLITDNNVSELVLGTGTVLDKHDYISNETGCMNQWGICYSKDSIAWFDMNKKKLFRYHGGTQALSDIKGMQSFFADNLTGGILSSHNIPTALITTPTYGDNPIYVNGILGWAGINCVYDDRYNEYVFTFSNTKPSTTKFNALPVYNYFTIAFTESLEAFSSFYSLDPAIYIKTWNKLLTTPKNAPNQIWLQDYGDFGSFYGKLYDSTVDYYVKENYRYTKVFDSLDYTCDVSTLATNGNEIVLLEEGLNKVRFSNSYQNTDWYDLVFYAGWSMPPLSSNQIPEVRRETCWGIAIPRNAVLFNAPSDPDIFNPANLDQIRPFRERLRDNYMFVNLVYHNADPITGLAKNYRCVLPYIVTRYRPSAR